MIFDGRAVSDIADDELARLVDEHIVEQQHVEFKVTFDYKNDAARLELLLDVAAMANGSGGYIIFGIRDDGKGRAQKFEPVLLGDANSVAQSIASLCHEHIDLRIEGLDIMVRSIRDNPLVVVRVPTSARTPHMVTFQRGTHFRIRAGDSKREMAIEEIRMAFTDDNIIARRLDRIEGLLARQSEEASRQAKWNQLEALTKSGVQPSLGVLEDGIILAEMARGRFITDAGTTPCLRISAVPLTPHRDQITSASDEIHQLLMNPPGSRDYGWSMKDSTAQIDNTVDGINRGDRSVESLNLFNNGYMEFRTLLNEHFCWGQDEAEFQRTPTLYPWPVTEYPTTFLRLYHAIAKSGNIVDDILIELEFRNLAGYHLRPYSPDRVGYSTSTGVYHESNYYDSVRVSANFDPDLVAFQLLSGFYGAFKLRPDQIPFYSSATGFSFESRIR